MSDSMNSPSSGHGANASTGPLHSEEALRLVQATVEQLRTSRRRLEAQPGSNPGHEDAVIYLATAEMHLQAAQRRLEGV